MSTGNKVCFSPWAWLFFGCFKFWSTILCHDLIIIMRRWERSARRKKGWVVNHDFFSQHPLEDFLCPAQINVFCFLLFIFLFYCVYMGAREWLSTFIGDTVNMQVWVKHDSELDFNHSLSFHHLCNGLSGQCCFAVLFLEWCFPSYICSSSYLY